MVHRVREHRIRLLGGHALLLLAQRRCAILQRDDVVALLVSGSHRRLDTAVRQKAAECDGVDAAAAKNEIEVGAGKPTKAALSFDNDVARLGLERIDDLGTPAALAKRLAVDDALEDAVRLLAETPIVYLRTLR